MRLPESFRGKTLQLLFKPDKNSLEFKALDAACTALGLSPMRLMVAVGGIANARALHEARQHHAVVAALARAEREMRCKSPASVVAGLAGAALGISL